MWGVYLGSPESRRNNASGFGSEYAVGIWGWIVRILSMQSGLPGSGTEIMRRELARCVQSGLAWQSVGNSVANWARFRYTIRAAKKV